MPKQFALGFDWQMCSGSGSLAAGTGTALVTEGDFITRAYAVSAFLKLQLYIGGAWSTIWQGGSGVWDVIMAISDGTNLRFANEDPGNIQSYKYAGVKKREGRP